MDGNTGSYLDVTRRNKGSLNLRGSDDDSYSAERPTNNVRVEVGEDHDTEVLERHEDEAIMNMYSNQAALTASAEAETKQMNGSDSTVRGGAAEARPNVAQLTFDLA